jgi:hypothetical protein
VQIGDQLIEDLAAMLAATPGTPGQVAEQTLIGQFV